MNNRKIQEKKRSILRSLVRLGNSTKDIATKLKAKGFKGNHNFDSCPISNYLMVAFKTKYVQSSYYSLIFNFEDNYIIVSTPRVVSDFIREFDDHRFPELEE